MFVCLSLSLSLSLSLKYMIFHLGSSDMSSGWSAALLFSVLAFNTPDPTPDRWCLGLGSLWFCTGVGHPGPVIVSPETTCHCFTDNHTLPVTSTQTRVRQPQVTESSFLARWAIGIVIIEIVVVIAVTVFRLRRASWFERKHAASDRAEDSSALSSRQLLVARARRALTNSNVSILDSQPRQRIA